MLIDLNWRPNSRCIIETPNGGLIVHRQKLIERIATRVAKGIYYGYVIGQSLREFTEWEAVNPIGRLVKLREAFERTQEERFRDQCLKECNRSYYGNADNLKQVLKYGGSFVRSADPFVLQLYWIDRTDLDGPYIGKGTDRFLRFKFIRLEKKDEA